jgi:DNA polymerase-3 subunit gamma/tau
MAHIALYRSWRPRTFGEVVGQEHVVRTLQNALKEGRFSHAYLFSGPRGTGKTSVAKILAKAVNCENGPDVEPCNRCANCLRIADGLMMDVVEIDAASNRGVEEIRDIRDNVKFAPTEGRRKVYIIDEVHMLTTEAFNALLKTLEEPPVHVMFILATTEPHRLPATIISRCQRFDFRRVSLKEQVERLEHVCRQERVEYEPDALQYIARLSEGGMRDALSLLDQIASYAGKRITTADVLLMTGGVASDQFGRLAAAIADNDIGAALDVIDGWMQEGKSADRCLENVIGYFRDLLMIRMVPQSDAIADRIVDPSALLGIAERFSGDELIRIIETLCGYQTELKYSAQPQTLLEVAVMKLCGLSRSGSAEAPDPNSANGSGPAVERKETSDRLEQQAKLIAQLADRIARLEQQLSQMSAAMGKVTRAAAEQAAAASPQAAPAPPPYRKSGIRLDRFVEHRNDEAFQKIVHQWSRVLSGVKERKITVHAWLIDGEPVAVCEDTILVAFKSSMHRETTERPANRQLIEQVLGEVYGQPLKLSTVMMKEWKDALEGAGASRAARPEPLRLEPEPAAQPREEWVREAIELFGEQLVVIKDDED